MWLSNWLQFSWPIYQCYPSWPGESLQFERRNCVRLVWRNYKMSIWKLEVVQNGENMAVIRSSRKRASNKNSLGDSVQQNWLNCVRNWYGEGGEGLSGLVIDTISTYIQCSLQGTKQKERYRRESAWERFRLSLIHIWRCRRSTLCRSRWSPYH